MAWLRVSVAASRRWRASRISRLRFDIAIRINRLTTVRFIGVPLLSVLVSGGLDNTPAIPPPPVKMRFVTVLAVGSQVAAP